MLRVFTVNSMSEFISYCKEHPGEVCIGFAGVGGFTYLAAQKFIADMGIDVKTVAYDSGSEVVTAVMGGFVDFCMQQPAELASGLESGALKCLATMSDEHHPSELLASVPTSKEEGLNLLLLSGVVFRLLEIFLRISRRLADSIESCSCEP